MAPIFTPPQSVARPSAAGSGGFDGSAFPRDVTGFLAEDVGPENTKEVFDVARNSVELLNTVLTSSPQQEALKVRVMPTIHIYISFLIVFVPIMIVMKASHTSKHTVNKVLLTEVVKHVIIVTCNKSESETDGSVH